MTSLARTLEIRTSPHIVSGRSVDFIMLHVVLALLPVAAFAVFVFGLAAALTLATAVGSCVFMEHLICRLSRRRTTVGDWSVTITGLLYGLTLPPGLPLWMTAIGGFIAVAMGKWLFGGLGFNVFNPALVGRAVLQAAFPVALTSWMPGLQPGRFTTLPSSTFTFPFASPVYDAVSGATPLALWKFDGQATPLQDLAFGLTSGSTGETGALLILAGGVYLAVRKLLNWRIPAGILGVVLLLGGALHLVDPSRFASPAFLLMAGGLMLGAVYMATDMVASPMTSAGCWVYGAFIGALVVVIRTWGGMPEGVMYAILLANAVSPHIDAMIRPRVYGARPKEKKS